MSIKHYITLEDNGEQVFSTLILGNNDFFNNDFKYYPKGSFDFLDKVEIDFEYLITYWRKWINDGKRNKIDSTECFKDDNSIVVDTYNGDYYILEPFIFVHNLKLFDCFYFENGKVKLKNNFKLYLEIH